MNTRWRKCRSSSPLDARKQARTPCPCAALAPMRKRLWALRKPLRRWPPRPCLQTYGDEGAGAPTDLIWIEVRTKTFKPPREGIRQEMKVPISIAKARLTDLVRRAEAGDDVVLTRHGCPVVRLAPVVGPRATERQRNKTHERLGLLETSRA